MHRLLRAVTAWSPVPAGRARGCGRREAHQSARRLPLGPGWAGGLGLGLGLALGAKLAGGLRGAVPAPPDPEAPPQAEPPPPPPPEQPLPPWSLQGPAPPAARRFARAIDSSRDLLHRIKVRRRGWGDVDGREPCAPECGAHRSRRLPGPADPTPRLLPRKTSHFPSASPVRCSWGLPRSGRRPRPVAGTAPSPMQRLLGTPPRRGAGRPALGAGLRGGAKVPVGGAWRRYRLRAGPGKALEDWLARVLLSELFLPFLF